mgnify:CR=1 FL=1
MSQGRFDVIVVGAGTAGSYAAYLLAKSGLKVALIERKPKEKIGEKVCGDAIGKHHFDNLKLSYPSGDELDGVFKGVKVYSPDEKFSIIVEGEGFAVNRYSFGQRLLKMALNSGAELYDKTHVIEPIVRNGFVKGVAAINLDSSSREVFEGEIVIDASGVASVVRTKLPEDWWISERIAPEDTNACYREIVETKDELDSTYAIIYLSKKIAPGGYWWFFPKSKHIANVGLGVQPIENAPNPINQYKIFIKVRRELKGSRKIHAGGGVVPTRRPLDCPVANGLLAIGDSAYTCNPIHGGGIGPSMVSAKCAAETILNALENYNEPTINALWPYPIKYIERYGAKQAPLDIFRMFLQRLSDDDLNFAFRRKVITGEEVNWVGSSGELKLSVERKLSKALRLISRPTLLYRLKTVRDYMEKIKALYSNYPEDPSNFIKWRAKVNALISDYLRKIR